MRPGQGGREVVGVKYIRASMRSKSSKSCWLCEEDGLWASVGETGESERLACE